MSKFTKELRIIPPIAWMLAILGALCMFFGLFLFGLPSDSHMRNWDRGAQALFSFWPAALIFCWVLLIGYVNADARRRGMRYIMWTLLAIFVPNTLGIILYFVLRDPLMIQCANCGAFGRTTFVFCPQCGSDLSPVCPRCRRAIEPGWKKCAYCGADISPTIAASGPENSHVTNS